MNLREKCLLWIEAAKTEHISDQSFDMLSWFLFKRYNKLPKWFREQVPAHNLSCGTAFDLDIDKLQPSIPNRMPPRASGKLTGAF